LLEIVRLQFDQNMLIIYGPTGVGKSDLACMIAKQLSAEIVNADIGQMYTPLSIGTAKPTWQSEPSRHHLFDVISDPLNCTVIQYRQMLSSVLNDIWSRGKLPIIVGGSGFYVQSIFYPPIAGSTDSKISGTWADLHAADPQRAASIHPNDSYRISRALSIWHSSGIKPSDCVRRFEPLAKAHIVWAGRDRAQLFGRINERVSVMVEQGWIDECKALVGTKWEDFIRHKKLIGYVELLDHIQGALELDVALSRIAQKTRAYAKRQETFWRMLKRSLESELHHNDFISFEELNLTLYDPYLYINQLSQRLDCFLQ
jgi:tRNA dimethylallyltransferase